MREGQTQPVRREDYTPPAYWIRRVELTFDLDPAKTIVGSKMTVERNAAQPMQPLRLSGDGLNLLRAAKPTPSQVKAAMADFDAAYQGFVAGTPPTD